MRLWFRRGWFLWHFHAVDTLQAQALLGVQGLFRALYGIIESCLSIPFTLMLILCY